ncbi:helix-turn-helix transcriptional regulator [uncultured Solobacterium sp.]|uniref:helix-turn-helix domain-containing protein n=1 Tax=uncultured Solobacterium sp. TaxID=747375 RepID=UPI0028D7A966|nr:helix-turn-helix transcriptional regulator [uncultured Solobacterium sp.]
MNISEKIRTLRKSKGMSQEELAGQVNISRQAVSRWENGTALPDADNIVQLSKLFGVTTDYLLMDSYESDEDSPKIKENNKILHANLTRLAIIFQAAFLNACIYPWGDSNTIVLETVMKLCPLLACSIWMASNHRYEKDLKQRAKNTKIESLYCLIQTVVFVLGYTLHIGLWSTLMIIINTNVYIFLVNPKYMNRKLTR